MQTTTIKKINASKSRWFELFKRAVRHKKISIIVITNNTGNAWNIEEKIWSFTRSPIPINTGSEYCTIWTRLNSEKKPRYLYDLTCYDKLHMDRKLEIFDHLTGIEYEIGYSTKSGSAYLDERISSNSLKLIVLMLAVILLIVVLFNKSSK